MGKIFAIGDIHGCRDLLEKLLKQPKIDPLDDTLVFVGDYIDRGPDSKGVVDRLIRLQEEYRQVVFLQGNHEGLFLDYYFRGKEERFFANGGLATIASYRTEKRFSPGEPTDESLACHFGVAKPQQESRGDLLLPEGHLDFFHSLLPFFETDDYYFVHAGIRPEIGLADQHIDDLTWIRNEFVHSPSLFPKTVVFGHTVFPEPFIRRDRIGIDTGAVFGGKLTCLELPAMKFYQA
ncbi:MAG: metallophosphoesterase family protein [Smithellaceae bacterium]|nr:metallophosphoesterase family protein [Smithellaceae bacterium]